MRIRRFLTPSAISCLLLLLFAYIYASPITLLYWVKHDARSNPAVWITPKPLADANITRGAAKSLSCFGYEFDVPWAQMEQQRAYKMAVVFADPPSGISVLVMDPSQEVGEMQGLKQAAAQQRVSAEGIFGVEPMRSNYAMLSTMLYLTPAALYVSLSPSGMVSRSLLLVLKETKVTAGTKSSIYSFQTGLFRGFQIGDPTQDKTVVIKAFDTQDRELTMFVAAHQVAKARPTQADINRILYSLHHTPSSGAEAPLPGF